MNYIAHARAYLTRPWMCVGVCIPDFLTGSERGLRPKKVFPTPVDEQSATLARGLKRHISDNAWFHKNSVFKKTQDDIAALITEACPGVRARFFAHIALEILLDACLVEEDPGVLDRFYETLGSLDPEEVHRKTQPFLNKESQRLGQTMTRFLKARFLEGYEDDAQVVQRLQGVAFGVRQRGKGLGRLDESVIDAIGLSREIVRHRSDALLTPEGPSPDRY